MRKILITILFLFLFQSFGQASSKQSIIKKLSDIENISFNFIQTINGKDERGNV